MASDFHQVLSLGFTSGGGDSVRRFEQYATPPAVALQCGSLAVRSTTDDGTRAIDNCCVVDLGAGAGALSVAAAMCGARFSMMVEVDPRAAARAAAAAESAAATASDAIRGMCGICSGSDSEADDEEEAAFARNVARCAMEIILADVTALPFGETKAPR
jgi:predicted nicotinamide N-methyase